MSHLRVRIDRSGRGRAFIDMSVVDTGSLTRRPPPRPLIDTVFKVKGWNRSCSLPVPAPAVPGSRALPVRPIYGLKNLVVSQLE